MTDRPDHSEIIAKLEKATGPDVDLNADILLALGWTTRDGVAFDPGGNPTMKIPDLVGSLDASLALVGERLPDASPGVMVEQRFANGAVTWGAWCLGGESGDEMSFAPTPPIAVLLALFRALESGS